MGHRDALAAVGVRTATGRDAVLAAAVAAATVALLLGTVYYLVEDAERVLGLPAASLQPTPARLASVLAVATAQALLLTFRRTRPAPCFAGVVLLQVVLVTLLPAGFSSRGPAVFMAAYAVGAYLPRRTAVAVIVGGTAVEAVLVALVGPPVPGLAAELAPVALLAPIVSTLLSNTGSALVGGYVREHRRYVAELHARVEQSRRERAALDAVAVARERGRMARELHDVAAHHLSAIVVQAGAAERLIPRDPDAAVAALRGIREQGRQTLENLRLVVGILREGGGADGERVPTPSLAEAGELVAAGRAAGAEIDFATVGEPYPLGPTADLTAYRVLQEALANARRHAPGAAVRARLTYRADGMEVLVENAPPPGGPLDPDAPPGHGIVGMAERAAMVGGSFHTARLRDGGWRVLLDLPRRVDGPGSDERGRDDPGSDDRGSDDDRPGGDRPGSHDQPGGDRPGGPDRPGSDRSGSPV